jgi:predicted DNA-binding transcriptional regulator YafY
MAPSPSDSGSYVTALRYLVMLRSLPRFPRRISTHALQIRLQEQSFDVTLRTIQRDLEKLSSMFPLLGDDARPRGWCWDKSAPPLDIPAMDLQTALTLHVVKTFCARLLPPSTMHYLNPYTEQAEKLLTATDQLSLPQWLDRIAVIPAGPPLSAPDVEPAVVEAVYDALLQSRQLSIRYRARGSSNAREAIIHPRGLVFRDHLAYLVCTFWDYRDIRQLALHRIEAAALLDTPVTTEPEFSLHTYLQETRAFEYIEGGTIELQVLFDAGTAHHLRETPLSGDQTLVNHPDGRVLLTATVIDSARLRWWLLGFGQLVEVLSPAPLRSAFADIVRTLHQRYSDA